MTALGKKIDKIAEAGSLVPGDVHNCVRRIVAIQEALDRSVASISNHLFRADTVVYFFMMLIHVYFSILL